ncbi:oxidoreductase [Klebsiella pneumoniae]|nr:oxidoreductase [Klebsiella pneumoniae]
MSKMIHDQPSAAVPASRDRRNFLIAGAGLALAATTLGRSGAVMAKPAGQDTPNAPSDAAPVRKETLTTRKLGSLEVSSMGLGCLPMVGYYGGGPRDRKAMVSLINLTARTIELEVIPACRHFGLGLIPWSPLAGGLLGGVLKKMASGRRARPASARLIEQYRPQLEAYEGLCEDLGETPSDVALAWLLQNPVVTAPLIGPRTVEQLQQALHATTVTLSDDTMSCLDEIWPGPGGEAPQAYAW